MPHIQQLASHVADLIAAGEVVERPASVVKELVENAIDAGSSAVVVEIRRGGMGLIRVTDNGCGIAPDELPTAFLRHATSKMRSAEDLGKIGTLGFRGEALAAIAAVSRVDILTRQKGAATGAALRLEGGAPGRVEEAGAPEGTSIAVCDLFFNTPARLKFMKKDSAETAAVAGLMQHLALSHPDVSFKFIKDGQETLHTPGDGKLESAIYAALGREFAKALVPVEGCSGEVSVRGFVTQPLMGRGSRSMQVFFVNGRFIKSQLLTAALEEGYRNQIMKGKFPGCVISVTLPVIAVDVNVHPAKTQVKFAREREVFDAVYHTVMDCLDAKDFLAAAPKPVQQVANPRQDFFQSMDAKTYREKVPEKPAAPVQALQTSPGDSARPAPPAWNTERKSSAQVADSAPKRPVSSAFRPLEKSVGSAFGKPPASVTERPFVPAIPMAQQTMELPEQSGPKETDPAKGGTSETGDANTGSAAARDIRSGGMMPGQQTIGEPKEAPWRIAGEVLNTYIICESEDGCVWLIDKHAAHERINFDRLKESQEPPMRQTLLQPIAAELTKEDGALLLENLPLLEQFGFSCEDFGGGAVLVREVPADIDAADTVSTLEAFAENLRAGRSLAERRENLLHTMACKAAIKGGWHSDEAELRVLIDKVQSGEVQFCPHGRPVKVKLTRYEVEKMFKRA